MKIGFINMNQQVIMLRGLPGSGKSTWAKEQVLKSGGKIKRINKDDLRAMIDAGAWSKEREKTIIKMRNRMLQMFLNGGFSVIIDDTNLVPKHQTDLERLARLHGVEFIVNDSFIKVSVRECIERDSKRANPVGKKVILRMAKDNGVPFYTPKEVYSRPDLNNCILVDLDGTLAIHNGRDPYDTSKCETDVLNEPIHRIIQTELKHNQVACALDESTEVIFCSGRSEEFRRQTQDWLDKNGYFRSKLLMRPAGDKREDSVVKKELFDKYIRDWYNVLYVLDDRSRVVNMWREELGLTCLQVNFGDF
jgi:predicted kinase